MVEGFIQCFADVFGLRNQRRPAGATGKFAPLVFDFFFGLPAIQPLVLRQLGAALFEYVVKPLEKQQAEDVVLKVG
jgi:hypothetical protein